MEVESSRRETDAMDLQRQMNQNLELIDNYPHKFYIKIRGPEDSVYVRGVWKIRVDLPQRYPLKPPSIRFVNKIFHPNVNEVSGRIDLDLLDVSWSPYFDLVIVFTKFLPRFFKYPKPSFNPINRDAASLFSDKSAFGARVRDYIGQYATEDALRKQKGKMELEVAEQETTRTEEKDNVGECLICLEEYDLENPSYALMCDNEFHLGCILDWLETSDLCPLCYKPNRFLPPVGRGN